MTELLARADGDLDALVELDKALLEGELGITGLDVDYWRGIVRRYIDDALAEYSPAEPGYPVPVAEMTKERVAQAITSGIVFGGDEELLEARIWVEPYRREGEQVSGYWRVVSAIEDLIDPDNDTTEVFTPGGYTLTATDGEGGRRGVAVKRPDGSEQVYEDPREGAAEVVGGEAFVQPEAGRVEHLQFGHERTALNDEVLGKDVKDTLEKHTQAVAGRNRYTVERQKLHRRIVLQILDEIEEGRENPEILFTAGGPSSGKSAILDPDKGEGGVARAPSPEGAVHLDQDIVKAELPEYQTLAEAKDPYASDAVHREAADVYRAILDEAQRRKMNVVAEGTGNSGPGQFVARLSDAKRRGYSTQVVAVTLPTPLAESRAVGRAEETGRTVPVDPLRAMHANFAKSFQEVLDNPDVVDRLDVWDNRGDWKKGETPTEIARKAPGGEFQVVNDALWEELLAKATEHSGSTVQLETFL